MQSEVPASRCFLLIKINFRAVILMKEQRALEENSLIYCVHVINIVEHLYHLSCEQIR